MFWSRQEPRQPPARVPTDAVIPLHMVDRTPGIQNIPLHFTWRFDDMLDIDKLRAALDRLVQIGHWNKLGARIRPRGDGRFEWHLPAVFSNERPAYAWSNEKKHSTLREDPLNSQIPDPAESLSAPDEARIVGNHPVSFARLVLPECFPWKLEDWIYSDSPALYIHTTQFDDATLLTLSFPHELMDGMATTAFLRSWINVLHGREDLVEPTLDFRRDIVADALIDKVPKEKSVSYPSIMSGFQIFRLVINIIWETFTKPVTGGLIRIPEQHIKGLRRHAQESLLLLPNGEKPFFSESDVLMAWLGRATARAMNARPTKPFVFINALDMRKALHDEIPPGRTFIGNCISVSTARVSALNLTEDGLGQNATMIRQRLEVQRTREQLSATYQIRWEAAKKTKSHSIPMVPMGVPDMTIIYWSNWLAGKYYDLDFSPAVVIVGRPPHERACRVGFPSWMGTFSNDRIFGWDRNNGHLTGRDPSGNWWLQWNARKDVWPALERELAALSRGVYH